MAMLKQKTLERLKVATSDLYPNSSEDARVNHILDKVLDGSGDNHIIVNQPGLSPEILKIITRYNDTGEMTANEIVLNMEQQMRSMEEFLVSNEYNAFKVWQRERAVKNG